MSLSKDSIFKFELKIGDVKSTTLDTVQACVFEVGVLVEIMFK